jgi:hypothetical protein
MPPVMRERLRFSLVVPALLDGDRARAADRGDVERERLRRADVRRAEPAEQDAQHGVGVGAVPTVERALAPIRSWSTMIAVVSPSSRSTSGRASVGMKPCTKAL